MTTLKQSLLIFLAWTSLTAGQSGLAQTANTPGFNAQLIVAARQADMEGIKKSLAQGAAPNSRNRLGKTPLYFAVEKNRLDIVQLMLDAGADVNLASLEKVTPLIAASYAGNVKIVELLLSKNPRLEETDRMHKSALVYAAGMGHTAIAERLIEVHLDHWRYLEVHRPAAF